MKKELTSIELRFLTKELQNLVNGKIDQIYQPKETEMLFQIHLPSKGKQLLYTVLPSFIFLTSEKPEIPLDVTEFCSVLRDRLTNARIRSIQQIQNERILEITLEKEKEYLLIIELFSKGNIILCEGKKILFTLFTQKWKDRTIRPGQEYIFPEEKCNPFDKKSFDETIHSNKKESLSKILAVKLGLGKIYAEELCLRTEINKLATEINQKEIDTLFDELNKMIIQPVNARIIYQNKEILDIIPIGMKFYQNTEQQRFNTYNEALESALNKMLATSKKTGVESKFTSHLKQIETKIAKQKQTQEKLEKEAVENLRKGEMIYENYQKVKETLTGRKRGEKIKIKL